MPVIKKQKKYETFQRFDQMLGKEASKKWFRHFEIIILLLDNFRLARKQHIKGWSRLIFNLFVLLFWCFWIEVNSPLFFSGHLNLSRFFFSRLLKGSQKNKMRKLMNKISGKHNFIWLLDSNWSLRPFLLNFDFSCFLAF